MASNTPDLDVFRNLAREVAEDTCTQLNQQVVDQINKRVDELLIKSLKHKREIDQLKEEVDDLKNHNKRCTLIINGITEKKEDQKKTKENVKGLMAQIISTRITTFKANDIENAYRIGAASKGKIRPIILTLKDITTK